MVYMCVCVARVFQVLRYDVHVCVWCGCSKYFGMMYMCVCVVRVFQVLRYDVHVCASCWQLHNEITPIDTLTLRVIATCHTMSWNESCHRMSWNESFHRMSWNESCHRMSWNESDKMCSELMCIFNLSDTSVV